MSSTSFRHSFAAVQLICTHALAEEKVKDLDRLVYQPITSIVRALGGAVHTR
jgi:hypothetical protein